ncbi:uncharacterized protein LOC117328341 [Pecten maximus]|uniref:uncharacterized protein LOC117328341 n=1 Tax=Pecten maximus TaxID=6579 RepID=UPI001457E858|nr:uncharacterized protein LOC117328341 [Pecten maximus]
MADDVNEELRTLCIKSVSIFMEKVMKMIPRVKLRDYTMQCIGCVPMTYLGSQAECIHGLNSDTDIMYECQTVKVVQNLEQTREMATSQDGYDAVVMFDSDGTHDGYTKIKLFDIRRDQNYEEVDVSSLCVDRYLSNSLVSAFWKERLARRDLFPSHGMKTGLYQHGPCITFKYTGMENRLDTDIDSVFTIPCNWPEQAREWFTRQRNHDWPSEKLRNQIKSIGCHLVPVGHALSHQRDMEWRISFNKPERELVWSFSGTQFACVDFMKIFFHVKISPNFPDLFPSYFIKTVMFWMIEESNSSLWKPENLCSCLEELLHRITICVERKELRNYFIPSNNMMDTKPSDGLAALLVELTKFQKIGHEKWKPIMKARIDEKDENDIYFYHVQINALSTVRHYIINLLSTTNNAEFVMCLKHINQSIAFAIEQKLSVDIWAIFQVEVDTIQRFHEQFSKKGRPYNDSLMDERGESSSQDMQMEANDKLTVWLKRQRKMYFSSGCSELATWYLYQGRYTEAREVVEELLSSYNDSIVHYTFHNRDKKPKDSNYDMMFPRPSLEETLRKFISFDAIFLPILKSLYPESIQTVLEKTGTVLFVSPLFYCNLIKFHSYKAEGCDAASSEVAKQLMAFAKTDQSITVMQLASACVAMV